MFWIDVFRTPLGRNDGAQGVVLVDAQTGEFGGVQVLQGLQGAAMLPVTDETARVELPAHGGAISVLCSGGRTRFALGLAEVEASAESHVIGVNERLELRVGNATHLAAIGDDGVSAAQLDISGLGMPPVYA